MIRVNSARGLGESQPLFELGVSGRPVRQARRPGGLVRARFDVSFVIARLGVTDVRAFGLAWEDCKELLHKLGFEPRVEVVAA